MDYVVLSWLDSFQFRNIYEKVAVEKGERGNVERRGIYIRGVRWHQQRGLLRRLWAYYVTGLVKPINRDIFTYISLMKHPRKKQNHALHKWVIHNLSESLMGRAPHHEQHINMYPPPAIHLHQSTQTHTNKQTHTHTLKNRSRNLILRLTYNFLIRFGYRLQNWGKVKKGDHPYHLWIRNWMKEKDWLFFLLISRPLELALTWHIWYVKAGWKWITAISWFRSLYILLQREICNRRLK
jgi:hypothetical protein